MGRPCDGYNGNVLRYMSITPNAYANMLGSPEYPEIRGIVRFTQLETGVFVEAEITGLPETDTDFFGFHLHWGTCSSEGAGPTDYFPNTEGHYNPTDQPHPRHAGDFPPLLATGSGSAYLAFVTDRFSVQDALGRAVVIHLERDDFTTQPAGDTGRKIACGIVSPNIRL